MSERVSRVFVVQVQHRFDRESRQLVPKFDMTPAEEYGELVDLLGPNAAPFNPEPIIQELHERLRDFGDNDHLLLIGNPCIIGWAVAIAADYNDGRVSLLQWSGKERRYLPIQAELFMD